MYIHVLGDMYIIERESAREIVVDRECGYVFHRHVGGGDCG